MSLTSLPGVVNVNTKKKIHAKKSHVVRKRFNIMVFSFPSSLKHVSYANNFLFSLLLLRISSERFTNQLLRCGVNY